MQISFKAFAKFTNIQGLLNTLRKVKHKTQEVEDAA